jgi:hypothetical protein
LIGGLREEVVQDADLYNYCRKELVTALQDKNAQDISAVHLPAIATVAAISATITAITTTAATATASPTAASVAAPAAAIPAAAPWPPAPTAASTFRLGPCFVHHQVAPAEVLAVEGVHSAIGVFVIVHFHKRESARLPGEPVANQINA